MAEDFIKVIEDGMEKSKTTTSTIKPTTKKKSTKKPEPIEEPVEDEMEIVDDIVDDNTVPFDIDDTEDVMITLDDARMAAIRSAFKNSNADIKSKVKSYLVEYGNKLVDTMKNSDVDAIESILGLSDEV